MKQYTRINIVTKLSSNPILLFLIWLLLIIIPYISIIICIESVLRKSEKLILSKEKSQLIKETNKFRSDLTSTSYINSKLSAFYFRKTIQEHDAASITRELEKYSKSKISALFIYNNYTQSLDSYLSNDIKKDLRMFGRKSMIKLLSDFLPSNNKKSYLDVNTTSLSKLLSAAGGIDIQPNTAFPILSGKEKLGKMIGFLKNNFNENRNIVLLCLFRDKDIPLKAIVENSFGLASEKYKRELITLNTSYNSNLGNNIGKEFFKFFYDDNKGLSIISKSSDYMLNRLGTLNTYYPLNLKGLSKNEPILKVSISSNHIVHPMRKLIKILHFPAIFLIILLSFGLIKVGIFGYTSNIKILSRVVFCVTGAVLLPFASFLISAYFNLYLEKEFEKNEIQSFTQIQTDMINKAIESYIANKELAISELREEIISLTPNEANKRLNDWFKTSGANALSCKYFDDNEIRIDIPKPLPISKLGLEVKEIFDLCIDKYLNYYDFNGISNYESLQKKFKLSQPYQLSPTILNIGKIYCSVPNEPDCLYSIFPIYEDEKEAKKVIASVVIKFDTKEIIKYIKELLPDLFSIKKMGNYTIYNAIIPISSNGNLFYDKMVSSDGFKFEDIKDKIDQISFDRSKNSWSNSEIINTGMYLNNINSVVVSRANKGKSNSILVKSLDIKNIIIYAFLMVITLSVALSGIIVAPIKRLKTASEKIAEGDYTNKIEWKSGDEFENLCNGFNEMTNALAQKEKMTSYVSKEVINEVSSNIEHQLQPGGERIPVSVLFCALKGKKELSSYSPEEVTKIISCLIDAVDEISTRYNGQIDKLIEDTVMVVFRQINKEENITLNACKTALEVNKRLQIELPDFKINMGVASGEAVSGKIGSRNGKLDYTVIGNPVNLSARLKVQAYKAKNTGILICPNSIRKLHGVGRLNYIERMAIKGRTNRTFPLYELLSLRDNYEII